MNEEKLKKALEIQKKIRRLESIINGGEFQKEFLPKKFLISTIGTQGEEAEWITDDLTIMESIEKLIIEDLHVSVEMLKKEFKEL